MKLSRSAGSLMVSAFIVLFLCACVVSLVLWAVLIGDLCAGKGLECNSEDRGWSGKLGRIQVASEHRAKFPDRRWPVSALVPRRPSRDDRDIRMTNSVVVSGCSWAT